MLSGDRAGRGGEKAGVPVLVLLMAFRAILDIVGCLSGPQFSFL